MKETPIIKRRALLSGAAAFMAGVFTSRAESAIASHDPSSEPCDDPFCLEHTNETGATTTWDHVGTSTALVLTAPGEALRVNGRTVNVNVSQQFRAASSGSAGSSSLSAWAHTAGATVEAFASGPNGGAGLGVSSDSSGASVGVSATGPAGFAGLSVTPGGVSILGSDLVVLNAPVIGLTSEFLNYTPSGGSTPSVSIEAQPGGQSNVSIVGDLRINGDLTALTATATNVIADTGQF
ncbi:MAG TPA: hypothetical protein VMM78_00535, partial [Thermomicrobiales bacterium]|nr:hypothetical protein [Thermomicrobiales bacterium]